ncbi:MAG: alanine-tRNA synthetase second additional domain-containing protein [Bacteroidetes bacterium]|nr:alanine-tRNA synthetase second additional domain-containing protein [Bacteroidota bacterium]
MNAGDNIGGYDASPCNGLHVSHTKEIGRFKIISTNYNDSVLRIRFELFDE